MKTIKKLSIVIIIFFALSCSNDNSSNEESKATVKDIYVCGYVKKSNEGKLIATIWKNGVATSLSDGKRDVEVRDITVSGSDVYAVGYELDHNQNSIPRLWKNGEALPFPDSRPGTMIRLVEVIGTDLYIIGTTYENDLEVQKIWKNGIGSTIQDNINSITTNNTDFFGVGFLEGKSRLWKNGVGSNLTNEDFNSSAKDIEVKGEDVYIVGFKEINDIPVGVLWKNGNVSNISDGKVSTIANHISMVGNDIYISGYENNEGIMTSKVWKNGEVIWYKENFGTTDLKAVGKDFYILSNDGQSAKILKNGVPENLSSAFSSSANALFITTN